MSHGPQLHETRIGQRLFEHTLPELVRQLTRIADALEKQADDKQRRQDPSENTGDPDR